MFRSAKDEDDNLYDFNASLGAGVAAPGTAMGQGKLFSYKAPPGTSGQRPPMQSSMGRNGNAPGARLGTSMAGPGGAGEARPMTSVSGAGYKGSVAAKAGGSFDPLNVGKGPAPPLAEKSDNSPEDKAKEMERKVHKLIEESAEAVVAKEMPRALEKAKEAGKSERALCKFRESHGLVEQINLDLTYAICFNLANAYHHNKMYEEAINTYQLIVKNKQYSQSGRLRINMGNIYYEQKKYTQAIKMYRMALDQIPATGKELRFRILRNIGNAFVKMGQFQDAVDNFEAVMAGSPDIQTAFNLMLCLYARGDKDKMRRHFMKMLTISIPGMTEEDEERVKGGHRMDLDHEIDHIISDQVDGLKEELHKRQEEFNEKILTAARLIAPVADDSEDWILGYKWVMDQLRQDFESVCSKLELDYSMQYMKQRKFEDAIEILKAFERKDASLRAMAATNLSFIYFLEEDYKQAERHADAAVKADRYNAKALVNKGNCLFMAGDFPRAKEMYLEAVGVEANCVEALFNLGLVNLKMGGLAEAQQAFDKLHTILPSVTEALFHIGSIYEARSDLEQAAKTFEMLLNKVPGDPNICVRLGQVYERLEDDTTACHWHSESHRHYPVNLNVISWLGVWYVKREMYEQAIEYFNQAAKVQPNEVKWRLMVSSCFRRLGDLHKSLELYIQIHEDFPDNVESLQYLEALCKDLGRPHDEYSKKLEKLRRSLPAQVATQQGATRMGGGQVTQQRIESKPSRPDRPERPERPQQSQPKQSSTRSDLDDITGSLSSDRQYSQGSNPSGHMAAPRAGSMSGSGSGSVSNMGRKSSSVDDEDDFADTDVGDLLG